MSEFGESFFRNIASRLEDTFVGTPLNLINRFLPTANSLDEEEDEETELREAMRRSKLQHEREEAQREYEEEAILRMEATGRNEQEVCISFV